jgi:type I restriction enzyme S subunit
MFSEWTWVTLGDGPLKVIDGDRGKNYPSQHDFNSSGYCLFLNAGNVTKNGFAFSDCAFISNAKDASLGKGKLQPDDVVLTTRGTVGNSAYFDATIPFDNVRINSGMVLFRAQSTVLLPRFLYFFVRSELFRHQVAGLLTGSAQPQLPIRDINRIRMPLPSASEQRTIVQILGALDDKIELNRKMSATLEAIARALFKSWFVDFDPVRAKAEGRDPGLPAEIAALFPDSFEETAHGQIPSGWKVGPLGEVARNTRNGISHNDISEGTPYIGLEHMPRRSIALDRWGHAFQLESNKSEFQKGNILFGKLRPYFHKVGIAPVDGVCSTDILVISETSADWSAFVLMHLSSDALVAHTDRCSTGTKMPRASWDHIGTYEVVLPPLEIARLLTAAISPMTGRIIAGIYESRTLAALRDALLPKLISGELRVGEAERVLAASA